MTMEQALLDGYRQKLAALKNMARELKESAEDFPALKRNLARVEASLNMMALNLGLSVLDES